MLILGVDPGTARTGYGVVRSEGTVNTLIECGIIRTQARARLSLRLREIHEGISEVIVRHGPTVLCIEDVFYARNVRTTIVLGHARGVIMLAAEQSGLEVCEMPPAEIKKAVAGTGAATKEQVQFMVARLLRLQSAPSPSDAADGVAAALAYSIGPRSPRFPRIVAPPARLPRLPIAVPLARR
jgi:crossover junction endodeoxyribonuclease RuvC